MLNVLDLTFVALIQLRQLGTKPAAIKIRYTSMFASSGCCRHIMSKEQAHRSPRFQFLSLLHSVTKPHPLLSINRPTRLSQNNTSWWWSSNRRCPQTILLSSHLLAIYFGILPELVIVLRHIHLRCISSTCCH